MSDLISREEAISALLEKGQRSKRYKLGETWELDFDEIREALATVPPAKNEAELDKLIPQLNKCHEYIDKLEVECKDLKEKLHETELDFDKEQLRGGLRYRDGVIYGLKFAIRCNGVSGGEVDQ